MTKLDLARLVNWAGTLRGRKRLQKVVYLLQEAGCALGAEYTLHHYGPYSRDVAAVCDDLVIAGLLDESTTGNGVGIEYWYKLSDKGDELLRAVMSDPRGTVGAAALDQHRELANSLFQTNLWELELASTMVYFRRMTKSWDDAVRKTCEFKRVERSGPSVAAAERLAKGIAG